MTDSPDPFEDVNEGYGVDASAYAYHHILSWCNEAVV